MSMIQKQVISKAIKDPLFAKDIFTELPVSSFDEAEEYKEICSVISRYYQTNSKPLDENTLVTLVEDRLLRRNASPDKIAGYLKVTNELYRVVEVEQNEEIIDQQIQKYVRSTLSANLIRNTLAKESLDDEGVIEKLSEELKKISIMSTSDVSSKLFDFFEDVEQKKTLYSNMKQNRFSTGFPSIDAVSDGGLARGEMGLVMAASGTGKALKNGSKVQTPNGKVNIEELNVGDRVFGTDGNPHSVTGVFPQGKKQVFEVTFSDGTIIECNDEHLWSYQTQSMRGRRSEELRTSTLREIMDEVPLKLNGAWNVYVPMTKPVEYPKQDVAIPPYTLGALLGDGSFRDTWSAGFTNAEEDVVQRVHAELETIGFKLSKRGTKVDNAFCIAMTDEKKKTFTHKKPNYLKEKSSLTQALQSQGLWGTDSKGKFIPREYLQNTVEIRVDLLKGLIDTDGFVTTSSYEFSTSSNQMAIDVKELVSSLGMTASVTERTTFYTHKGDKIAGSPSYRIRIKPSSTITKIHSSSKHEARFKKGQSEARLTIRDIKETNRQEDMTCISVDSNDKLFLADNFIATHNTTWSSQQTINYVKKGMNVLYIVLEEKLDRMLLKLEQNLLGMQKSVILNSDGTVKEDVFYAIQDQYKTVPTLGNLYISKHNPQEVTVTMLEQIIVDASIRKGVQIDAVIIDYPDLMRNHHLKYGSESDAGGKLYEDIRALAGRYGFVCWVLSQLNRTAYSQEVRTAESIEGSKRKLNAVEIAFTLNQKKEEKQEGFLRIHLDKIRYAGDSNYDTIQYFRVSPDGYTIRDATPDEIVYGKSLVTSSTPAPEKKNGYQSAKDNVDRINNAI